MYKRSQITLFVIIGLIFLVMISLAAHLYIKSNDTAIILSDVKSSKDLNPPTLIIPTRNSISEVPQLYKYNHIPLKNANLKDYLTDCLNVQITSDLYYMAAHGGMLLPDSNSIITEFGVIASYPSDIDFKSVRATLEKEMSLAVQSALEQCLDLETLTSSPDINITPGKTNTLIAIDGLHISLVEPVYISTGNSNIQIDQLSINISSNYAQILDIEEKIISKNSQNTEWLDVAYLKSLDLPVSVMPYSGQDVIYSISDSFVNPSYTFIFAISNDANSPPVLDFIPDMRLKLGATLNYDLIGADLDNDDIFYFCESGCTVDENTGELTYVASTVGTNTIIIGCRDSHNNVVKQEVKLYVEP